MNVSMQVYGKKHKKWKLQNKNDQNRKTSISNIKLPLDFWIEKLQDAPDNYFSFLIKKTETHAV